MALTLPYPSMNFVPLDVLTAAEQNQLVANIEYIANQFPITSQNIDWTTMGLVFSGATSQSETITQTANYQYKVISGLTSTVPVEPGGKYLIVAALSLNSTYNNGNTDFGVNILVGGTNKGTVLTGGTSYQSIVAFGEVDVISSTQMTVEVSIGGRVPGTYTVYTGSSLRVFRVK